MEERYTVVRQINVWVTPEGTYMHSRNLLQEGRLYCSRRGTQVFLQNSWPPDPGSLLRLKKEEVRFDEKSEHTKHANTNTVKLKKTTQVDTTVLKERNS